MEICRSKVVSLALLSVAGAVLLFLALLRRNSPACSARGMHHAVQHACYTQAMTESPSHEWNQALMKPVPVDWDIEFATAPEGYPYPE